MEDGPLLTFLNRVPGGRVRVGGDCPAIALLLRQDCLPVEVPLARTEGLTVDVLRPVLLLESGKW